jgi:hypothetical protein
MKLSGISSKLKNFFNFSKAMEIKLGDIDLSDALDSLPGVSGENKLFLGRFHDGDLLKMMEKIGLVEHLKHLGFNELLVDLDRDENNIHYFKLYWKDKNHENQLIDLRLSETTFCPDKKFFEEGITPPVYDMMVIEWLSAKNPLKTFDETRPQLPGQTKPGLGIMKFCFKMLYIMAREVYKDGFLDVPEHMHGAIMYSKKFKFFDPIHEAIIRAVMRDLERYSLADITWGVITETIIDRHKNKPAVYAPGEQIFPVSRRLKKYFKSKKYQNTFKRYYNKKRYYLDYEEMKKRREEILKTKKIEDLC